MAAACAALSIYLQHILLIVEEPVRTVLNNQGLQSLNGFVTLTERKYH